MHQTPRKCIHYRTMQCTRASSTKPHTHTQTHTHTVGSEGGRDGVRRRTAAASSICNSIHVVKHGGGLAMGLVGSLLLRLVGEKLSDLPRHKTKGEEIFQNYGNISYAYTSFILVSVCTPLSPERRYTHSTRSTSIFKKDPCILTPAPDRAVSSVVQRSCRCQEKARPVGRAQGTCPSLCFSSHSQTISNLKRKNVASRAAGLPFLFCDSPGRKRCEITNKDDKKLHRTAQATLHITPTHNPAQASLTIARLNREESPVFRVNCQFTRLFLPLRTKKSLHPQIGTCAIQRMG